MTQYTEFSLNEKIILIMVGLPARGKSYTSNNLQRYLSWSGLKCKVFNSGNIRRKYHPDKKTADFFDPKNINNYNLRNEISNTCFDMMIDYMKNEGQIGIFDATNTTIERRKKICEKIKSTKLKFKCIFIEIITNDDKLIENNLKLKMLSPDYVSIDSNIAYNDFSLRLKHYISKYQKITDSEQINYIKVFKEYNSIVTHNVFGAIETTITSYLQNLQINKNPIYISRHGESIYNTQDRIGGDSELTLNGEQYSIKLSEFMKSENNNFKTYTSCFKRTIMTGKYITENKISCNLLNEINAGICEHMTYKEVEKKFPELYESRKKNKLEFRYPEGESYLDLVEKLKLFVLNLECIDTPILIISHRAVIRILLSYYLNINLKEITSIDVKLNQLIKLTPSSSNYKIEYIDLTP